MGFESGWAKSPSERPMIMIAVMGSPRYVDLCNPDMGGVIWRDPQEYC